MLYNTGCLINHFYHHAAGIPVFTNGALHGIRADKIVDFPEFLLFFFLCHGKLVDQLSDTPEADAGIPIFFYITGYQSFEIGPATLDKRPLEDAVIGHNESLFIEMASEKRPNLGSGHLGKQMIAVQLLRRSIFGNAAYALPDWNHTAGKEFKPSGI